MQLAISVSLVVRLSSNMQILRKKETLYQEEISPIYYWTLLRLCLTLSVKNNGNKSERLQTFCTLMNKKRVTSSTFNEHLDTLSKRRYISVEPELGYAKRLFHYLNAGEIEQVCPTVANLTWRIGMEVFYNLLCVLLTLLLRYAPSVGKIVKEKWSAAVSMFREWRSRPSLCRHCGTAPCQVKRRSLWKPSGTRKEDKANFAKRSNAMMLFYYGLELSEVLTKELPWKELYLERKFVQHFEEEHVVLFPVCIQRQINYWYPVTR
ncbi:uncharacterized protein LOC110466713 isoform X2 [Mizuhopecten yessoensis]|uniref:uncharacterized protein LOC110466713 isoform X2 n=1 Tax=Mizuhopecten yessoensis TaxID=6573 RepID=UPI000B45F4C0|nr:uncharacterized protein LOC110466713 isoform X2 [Mizuhopecten yessoensis]